MTVTPITPSSALSEPSHAGQHNAINGSLANLDTRLSQLEAAAVSTVDDIEQARRAAHEWVVRGPLVSGTDLLLPILWNMTGHPVQYEAAKLSVYSAPGGSSIQVEIYTGTALTSGQYSDDMTTILVAPMEIPDGAFESPFYTASNGDFSGEMAPDMFLAARILQVGVEGAAGADLTIQLNRLL